MGQPPARRKGPEFPDPEQHEEKRNLYKEIRDLFIALRSQVKAGPDRDRLIRFANVLNPGAFIDESRLPYDSPSGKAKHQRREECLLALVSKLTRDYWDLVVSGGDAAGIEAQIKVLQGVQSKGLARCKVEGDEARGFVLA